MKSWGFSYVDAVYYGKQKGFTHGMTFHTEFHRTRTKMKGSPKCGGGGRRQRPLSYLVGVRETLYEMSCHVGNPSVFFSKLHQHMKTPMMSW